ncbi:DUF3017 domain-containing protein [Streptomyces sp. MA25(2023)]|uniref:DUF3017 domain-containing protein n=1 Tax=Streptomyces sp. MA25(2023) TaxID=3055078 RepID=UPI0025B1F43D|nr:DUF3017 domain-containing protein [Streptomyces sp. MA25(2023)]MDN3252279.1 DUF3017 domain-containing protein [Streptomyces sp. MA25(2023)]
MPAEDTDAGRSGRPGAGGRSGSPTHSENLKAPEHSEPPGPDDTAGPDDTTGPDDTAGPEDTTGPEDGITVRDPVSAPDVDGKPRRTTRRFPLFTRDTARPEGGGRAAAGDAPAPARQWPVLTVALLVGLGLLLTALDVFRWGTFLIGAALLVGAALRWAMSGVGMLAVRSRFTDIATYGVLGLTIALLALMVQPEPVLKLPFLQDILHFTVS